MVDIHSNYAFSCQTSDTLSLVERRCSPAGWLLFNSVCQQSKHNLPQIQSKYKHILPQIQSTQSPTNTVRTCQVFRYHHKDRGPQRRRNCSRGLESTKLNASLRAICAQLTRLRPHNGLLPFQFQRLSAWCRAIATLMTTYYLIHNKLHN